MAQSNSLPSPPFVQIEGVVNFRDLGGYAVRSPTSKPSGIIRPKYLYRSAQLTNITEAGTKALTVDNNIKHIYDLRSDPEIAQVKARFPDAPLEVPSTTLHRVPVYKDEDNSPIALAKKHALYAADDVPFVLESSSDLNNSISSSTMSYSPGYVQAYLDIALNAARTSSYRRIIDHILTYPSEPLVVHCTVGKDRTGVFFALLLSLCGVENEDIAYEYALTEIGMGKWRDYLIKRVMEGAGSVKKQAEDVDGVDETKLPARDEAERVVNAKKENMLAFLSLGVDGELGGARGYWTDKVGLTAEECDKVINTLVVEGVSFLPATASR